MNRLLLKNKLYTQVNEFVDGIFALKNCGTCAYADVEQNLCTKFEAAPPMKIVLSGCPEYARNTLLDVYDDDIPF